MEVQIDDCELLAQLEKTAEDAYDRMYDDAQRAWVEWSEARDSFREAIGLAERLGLLDHAQRLRARYDHVRAVYDHQFRGC